MSQLDSGNFTGMSPPAPPTEPPPLMDEAKGWPKVVGIVSIVWASLGLVCTACSVAGTFMNQQGPNGQPLPAELKPSILQYGVMGVGTLLAIMLLVAGIMLVARNRAARMVFLVYSVLAIIVALVGLYGAIVQYQAMNAWITANPENELAKMMASPAVKGAQIGIMVIALFISFAWPLFCVVWFGLIKRNAAEIDAGVDDSVV